MTQPGDLGPHLWLARIRKLEALHERRVRTPPLRTHLVVVATVQAGERFLRIVSELPCKPFVHMRQILLKPLQRPLCRGRAPVIEGVELSVMRTARALVTSGFD